MNEEFKVTKEMVLSYIQKSKGKEINEEDVYFKLDNVVKLVNVLSDIIVNKTNQLWQKKVDALKEYVKKLSFNCCKDDKVVDLVEVLQLISKINNKGDE